MEGEKQIVKHMYSMIYYLKYKILKNHLCICIHGHLYLKIRGENSRLSRMVCMELLIVISSQKCGIQER